MKVFLRAITTGFALSLGAALFKKVAKHVGLDDDAKKKEKDEADKDKDKDDGNPATDPVGADGATDPGLRARYS